MSWTRLGGTTSSALASWATTGASPSAATTSARLPAGPTIATPPAATAKRSGEGGSSSPSAVSQSAHGDGQLALQGGDVGQRALAQLDADRDGGRRRRRGLVGVAQRLLQAAQRVAQLELAKDLAQAGAVGLARERGRDVQVGAGHVALGGGQLLGDPRDVGVLAQVLLALGARDVVDVVQDALQRPELLQQLGGGLVADPRDAGDVVGRVALEPVEVGDQLGADAVAVDDVLRGRRAWSR